MHKNVVLTPDIHNVEGWKAGIIVKFTVSVWELRFLSQPDASWCGVQRSTRTRTGLGDVGAITLGRKHGRKQAGRAARSQDCKVELDLVSRGRCGSPDVAARVKAPRGGKSQLELMNLDFSPRARRGVTERSRTGSVYHKRLGNRSARFHRSALSSPIRRSASLAQSGL